MKDLDNLSVVWVLGIIAVGAMMLLPAQLAANIALSVGSGLVGYLAKQVKDAVASSSQSSPQS